MPSRERLRQPSSPEDFQNALWLPARRLELLKDAVPAEDCTHGYRRTGRAQFHDYLADFANHNEELSPPPKGEGALWFDLLAYGRQELAPKPPPKKGDKKPKTMNDTVNEGNDLFETLLDNIEPKRVPAVLQRLLKVLAGAVGRFLAKYSFEEIKQLEQAEKFNSDWEKVLSDQAQLQRELDPTTEDIVTAIECITNLDRYSREYEPLVKEAEVDTIFNELWKTLRLFTWLDTVIKEKEVLNPRSLKHAHAAVREMSRSFGSPLSSRKVRALAYQQVTQGLPPGVEDPQKRFSSSFDDLVKAVDPRQARKICRELSQQLAKDVDDFLDALKKDVFSDDENLREAEKSFGKLVIDHADAVEAAVDGVNFRQLGEVRLELSTLKRKFDTLAIKKKPKKPSPRIFKSRADLEEELGKMLANVRRDTESSSLEHSTVHGAMSARTARRYRLLPAV